MDFQIPKFSKRRETENFPGIKITFAEEEENILERGESGMIATEGEFHNVVGKFTEFCPRVLVNNASLKSSFGHCRRFTAAIMSINRRR